MNADSVQSESICGVSLCCFGNSLGLAGIAGRMGNDLDPEKPEIPAPPSFPEPEKDPEPQPGSDPDVIPTPLPSPEPLPAMQAAARVKS